MIFNRFLSYPLQVLPHNFLLLLLPISWSRIWMQILDCQSSFLRRYLSTFFQAYRSSSENVLLCLVNSTALIWRWNYGWAKQQLHYLVWHSRNAKIWGFQDKSARRVCIYWRDVKSFFIWRRIKETMFLRHYGRGWKKKMDRRPRGRLGVTGLVSVCYHIDQ